MTRHRLDRGGDDHVNQAQWCIVMTRGLQTAPSRLDLRAADLALPFAAVLGDWLSPDLPICRSDPRWASIDARPDKSLPSVERLLIAPPAVRRSIRRWPNARRIISDGFVMSFAVIDQRPRFEPILETMPTVGDDQPRRRGRGPSLHDSLIGHSQSAHAHCGHSSLAWSGEFDARSDGERVKLVTRRKTAAALIVSVGLTLAACGTGGASHSVRLAPVSGSGAETASLPGGSAPVPAPAPPAVSPPASIASNCSTDVSSALQAWLTSLRPGKTVLVNSTACYRVDEGIKLKDRQRLTVYGGTFRNESVAPGPSAHSKGDPVFTVVGGFDVTLEAMRISGVNRGGYHARLAFAGGIELEGTAHATIRGVTVTSTFGDGITLAPLRGGANHDSGQILAPVSAVTIRDVTIKGAGRQGVTFAAVSGAQLSDVVVIHPGLDTFDMEADQANEGASDVTIDRCEASGGILFFANGGAGSGRRTGHITVERCTMTKPEGGSAVLVDRPGRAKVARGPFLFVADNLWCGASAYVACVQLSGADVTLSLVTFKFPASTTHEAVYHLGSGSQAMFENDVVKGYGRTGKVAASSSIHVSGGSWSPFSGAPGGTPRRAFGERTSG